jgi:hypothetical protein
MKELPIIETVVALAVGAIDPTPENLARFARRQPFQVWAPGLRLPPSRLKQSPSDACESWRYKNAFRPYVDGLRGKLRRYRRSADARRLRTMADIWEICLCRDAGGIEEARRLAASISEAEHFEEKMRPCYFPDAA